MKKMAKILIFTAYIAINILLLTLATEPECVSKFDYDYKIIEKLVELENQQNDLKTLLMEEKIKVKNLESEQKSYRLQASTYTRWGKTTCPGNGSSLVYTGYMGAAHYTNSGSGANYLCLTAQPLWGHYDESALSRGRIYGVEYEFWEHRHTGASQFFGQNVYNKNAPCAVCHVSRETSIMIPGRNECVEGWTREYSGYLVSGAHHHTQASEYICLDDRVDLLDGNDRNDDDAFVYFVDGECGKSLPCPPYVNNRELTCVVCSR